MRFLIAIIILQPLISNQVIYLGRIPLPARDRPAILDVMTRNTKQVDDGYETRLLWKDTVKEMPMNRSMALRRFHTFEARLDNDTELRKTVNEIIEGHITKGYAKEVTNVSSPRARYLPIFTVKNPNKPGKVRLVWDAAAKFRDVSLNSSLHAGPDLLEPLVGVLQRFRLGKFAVTGDIAEMFHRIKIHSDDWESQLFLWRNSKDDSIKTYSFKVMTFGACCSPALAQFVKNTHADKFVTSHPAAVNAIKSNHYVDDWLESCEDETQLIQLMRNVIDIHAAGGFTIRGWKSNSERINEEFGVPCQGDFHFEDSKTTAIKVLGMMWSRLQDDFQFVIDRERFGRDLFSGERVPTKIEVLRIAMTVFDPLGLISFNTVRPRLIMRETWRRDGGWTQYRTSKSRNGEYGPNLSGKSSR